VPDVLEGPDVPATPALPLDPLAMYRVDILPVDELYTKYCGKLLSSTKPVRLTLPVIVVFPVTRKLEPSNVRFDSPLI